MNLPEQVDYEARWQTWLEKGRRSDRIWASRERVAGRALMTAACFGVMIYVVLYRA